MRRLIVFNADLRYGLGKAPFAVLLQGGTDPSDTHGGLQPAASVLCLHRIEKSAPFQCIFFISLSYHYSIKLSIANFRAVPAVRDRTGRYAPSLAYIFTYRTSFPQVLYINAELKAELR